MIITYVILHYMVGKETIECANSILEATANSEHETRIVIVDNGSTNASYEEISATFKNNQRVTVLHSADNLGFAKGNNLGFIYAKRFLKTDFIVQLNNDTIVEQRDFNEVIVEKFTEYSYSILGPDIITLDGCHQNPGKCVDWSIAKLYKFRLKKYIQYYMAHFSCFDSLLSVNPNSFPKNRISEDVVNTALHGACYIFSPLYIKKYDGMYDKTFLYMEEDILRLRSQYNGDKMVYSPKLTIKHKEDIATNMVATKSIEKKKLIYENLLKSSKVYMQLKREYKQRKNWS